MYVHIYIYIQMDALIDKLSAGPQPTGHVSIHVVRIFGMRFHLQERWRFLGREIRRKNGDQSDQEPILLR